ncbi:MAG: translation initiation factor IF-2 subunit gamma [Candidatus Woesearchaeota archaeon]
MKPQPEINIGLIGHVDHGKTTLTERLSGKWTDTHSEELKRGITIRLGYADITFRKCQQCEKYTTKENCECGGKSIPIKKVSFIDAPGHESLMATMLAGAMIMDGALLLIAANEHCPQPQTREHLMAMQIIGLKNVVIIQNKIDLVTEERARQNYEEIKEFLKGTAYENSPVIPISAKYGVNIDAVIEAIIKHIPTPQRDTESPPLMLIARSFDINKPGIPPSKLVGGVLGGALVKGQLKVGEEIEIRPGRKMEKEGKSVWKPLFTKIVSIKTGGENVDSVTPGGSIALLTELDPSIVKSDQLVGAVVGRKNQLPPVWVSLTLETTLLDRVVGTKEDIIVEPIKMGEPLMLNVNSAATVGIVNNLSKNRFHCSLKLPVCADKGARVTISRRIGTRFRLIGYGIIIGE